MEVVRIRHEGLGNTSYLVEVAPARAIAVDPDRRARRYLESASERGWEIVAVFDTHVHADFVTGSLELRDRCGATLHLPKQAGAAFAHRGVVPGERLDVGDVEVEVLGTPGHTPEHVSYVFRGERSDAPLLFSGGALIAGGAARTDLVSAELTESLTRAEFHTLHHAFAELSDETQLLPTHGWGSFCSVGSDSHTSPTTLGAERASNPLIAIPDEEEFVDWWPTTFPAAPDYFFRMRTVNLSGPASIADIPPPPPLDPAAFQAKQENGALVVDARAPDAYAGGHIPRSLSIHYRSSYATWLGWVAPVDVPLLLVVDGEPLDRIVEDSLLVGYELFAGWLEGGIDAWRASGRRLATLKTVGPEEALPLLEGGTTPLDVREPDEFELGHIADAVAAPLGKLEDAIPRLLLEKPVLVYCASGERSTTAASILERHGVTGTMGLLHGYGAWPEAGRD